MDWKEKVIKERDELLLKITNLSEYLENDDNRIAIGDHHWGLLLAQREVMWKYFEILNERISK